MPTDINKGFDNGDLLRDIRTDILNPVTVKVAGLEKRIDDVKVIAEQSFNSVDVDYDNKLIEFHGVQGGGVANLTGMFREGSDLQIFDGSDKTESKVHEIKFTDSQMIRALSGEIELMYNWGRIVPDNQNKLTIGKTGVSVTSNPDALYFKGEGITVESTTPNITTVNIPPATPLTASILSGTPQTITSIQLEGETSGSAIGNGKLTLNLNAGGGTVTNQNFKGFFASLGDIESNVQDPIDGKSYAFAKDSTLGGQYYTPYFYVSGSWTELKQDPALTYFASGASTNQGVFSIKPNPGITIDSTGQLNLDGLSTPPTTHYFHGFFDTLDALKAEVPRPSLNHSFAYTKHANGNWIGRQWKYSAASSMNDWVIVAPIGAISMVASPGAGGVPSTVFGFYNNDQWSIDANGLASLNPIDTKTTVKIEDRTGAVETGSVNTLSFPKGKSMVSLGGTNKEELIINNPQRVIDYNRTWELGHNSEDYRGNLFYDITSRTWMGWGDPEAPGGVDVKWTRLFHRNMSSEVKDLVKRLPAKTASVQTGTLDDNPAWSYNGITYLEKDSDQLPEDLKNTCGGYITTSVQDKDDPGVTIAQHRIQTCVADRGSGGTWVRRYVSTGSPGSSVFWSPWVRTSFSHEDIEDHQKDPSAHKSVIKAYKVFSLLGKIKGILAQTAGSSLGGLHADNGIPLADNYGHTGDVNQDYLDVPYNGQYRLRGTISMSGYKDNTKSYPTGTWQLLFRKKDRNTQAYTPVGQFQYVHSDATKPFPVFSYLVDSFALDAEQELITNLTFSDPQGISTAHPDLYLVPSRSFIVLEDVNTKAGGAIARSMRMFFGNLDTTGDVGIKSHHANLDNPSTQIRVYGEKLNKTPVEMNKIS